MPTLKYLDAASGTYKPITLAPAAPTDTGWIALTPVSGSGTVQYRILGTLIWIRCNLTGLTSVPSGTNSTLVAAGGIPAAYRPVAMAYYCAANLGGSILGHVVINSDGSIALWNSSSGAVTVTRFLISYPASGNG